LQLLRGQKESSEGEREGQNWFMATKSQLELVAKCQPWPYWLTLGLRASNGDDNDHPDDDDE